MAKKVYITCKYYYVSKYTETDEKKNNLYDLKRWISIMTGLTLSERVKKFGEHEKGRLEDINRRDEYYTFNFIRMDEYSSTYIVGENENAIHVDIAVDDEQYIGKNTVAVYDSKKGILMLMCSRGGFSANTVTTYINSFFDEPVCVLTPIKVTKDYNKQTNKFKNISIKISSVKDYSTSPNAPYESVLEQAKNMGAKALSFEFSIGRKKKEYLDADVIRRIISDAYANLGVVSIARVKMEDEQGTAIYNLLENVKNCVLNLETDANGEIEYSKIADAMIMSFK